MTFRQLDRHTNAIVQLTVACVLVACASPVEINDRFAAAQGFSRSVVRGAGFSHVVYTTSTGEGSAWHIYIEGDGRPWQSRYSVAHDPTSAMPLMLRLMQQDAAPSIYLGRPCYQGMAEETDCKPWAWTHGRYSEQVVSSMQAALEKLIERHAISELALFGHSGGGALAMLLAERIPQIKTIVTLAGNLDTEAWTLKHGYSELAGSLNPAKRAGLPSAIRQYHFLGSEDRDIPHDLPEERGMNHIVIEGVGHAPGWEEVYCDILKRTGGKCRFQK